MPHRVLKNSLRGLGKALGIASKFCETFLIAKEDQCKAYFMGPVRPDINSLGEEIPYCMSHLDLGYMVNSLKWGLRQLLKRAPQVTPNLNTWKAF